MSLVNLAECDRCHGKMCKDCHTYCESCEKAVCIDCSADGLKDICHVCSKLYRRTPHDRVYVVVNGSKLPVTNPDALIGDGKKPPEPYLLISRMYMLKYHYRTVNPIVDREGKLAYVVYHLYYSLLEEYMMKDGVVYEYS